MFLQCFVLFNCGHHHHHGRRRRHRRGAVIIATSQSHRLLDFDGDWGARDSDTHNSFAILTNSLSQLETEASRTTDRSSDRARSLDRPDTEETVLVRERLQHLVRTQFPTDVVEAGVAGDVQRV